ncbi:MAG: DUF6054 family protein [Clostridia bacterium]
MAKCEYKLTGDFDTILTDINNEIINGSASATLEAQTDYSNGDVRLAVRVYERYSYMGGNRVSLNITMLDCNGEIAFSAITSGGSQAVFFKINTFGEEAFLEKVVAVVQKYRQ